MSHFWALFIVSCSWTRHRRNGLYPEVELGLTGLTSTSQNVRRTFYVLSVVSVQCFSPDVYHRILCSWTRHRRNGVRFPKYPHGCPSRLRYSGPTFHFWARWLVSCSWTRKCRNGVHFPTHTHIVFYDACVGLVQWSISTREDSHPIVYRWLWRLNLQ